MNLPDQSLIHHPSYDNIQKKINTCDKFRFIEDFRKEYRPAEIIEHLRRK
jgi:hypothetical protein